MTATAILAIIQALITVVGQVQTLYSQSKTVLSETDITQIDAALATLQATCDSDFSRVSAELATAAAQ